MKRIRTSHVGSFPLKHKDELIGKILLDLSSIGLDIPPYPQMRSFIDIFLDPLVANGFLTKKGEFYFSTPEILLKNPPPEAVVPEAFIASEFVRRNKLKFEGMRGPVTGPFTLASRVYLKSDISEGLKATALSKKEIVRNFFSPYVRSGVSLIRKLGYSYIFIDEPILGVIVGKRMNLFNYKPSDISEIIDYVFGGAKDRYKGIHVCGVISGRLFEILSNVESLNILNFEFYDSRRNIKVINPELLKAGEKVLAPGVASSKRPVVESLQEVFELLKEIYKLANGRIDLVSADCGFGGLGDEGLAFYNISIKKLSNIVRAVKLLNGK